MAWHNGDTCEPEPVTDRTRYQIKTWDIDKQKWTPQKGVPGRWLKPRELRPAIRKMLSLGYTFGDMFASLQRYDVKVKVRK